MRRRARGRGAAAPRTAARASADAAEPGVDHAEIVQELRIPIAGGARAFERRGSAGEVAGVAKRRPEPRLHVGRRGHGGGGGAQQRHGVAGAAARHQHRGGARARGREVWTLAQDRLQRRERVAGRPAVKLSSAALNRSFNATSRLGSSASV